MSAGMDFGILGRPFIAPVADEAPMSLAQLVPTAMSLADHLVSAATAGLGGDCVACRKGCSACCNYIVSLSAPEALFLWEHLGRLSSVRRKAIYERYLQAATTLLARRPPMESEVASPAVLSHWYADLQITCPFLEGGACSIYPIRPLVCREHISRSAASCKIDEAPEVASGDVGRLPFSLAEAMSRLSSEIEPSWPAAIALPVALIWASDPAVHHHQSRRSAGSLLARLAALAQQEAQAA